MPEGDDGWDKFQLEQLITVIKEVMPHPQAECVIATSLLTACLETVKEEVTACVVTVEGQEDKSWDNNVVNFTIDGVELTLEVRVRE